MTLEQLVDGCPIEGFWIAASQSCQNVASHGVTKSVPKHVVVSSEEEFPTVLNAVVQSLLDQQSIGEFKPFKLGVSILDKFEATQLRRSGHLKQGRAVSH